jgi:hypothetical protein
MSLEVMSPSATNIMKGGTRIWVQRTGTVGYIPLGYIEPVGVAPQIDTQEVISGYDGTRKVVKRYADVRSVEYTVTCNERTKEIVRAWLMGGAKSTVSQTGAEILVGGAKKISEILVGIAAYTDVVVGLAYRLSQGDGSKTPVHHLDKATPVTVADMVEGTDFVVDYEEGMITFGTVPVADKIMTLKYKTVSETKFSQFASAGISCSVRGVHVLEGGSRIERWELPSARLETSGDGKVDIENPTKLELKLVQLYDATNGFGTYSISEP